MLEKLKCLQKNNQIVGHHHNIPNDIYHHIDCPGISRSALTMINRSRGHYEHSKRRGYNSRAMTFGSAVHTRLLEPYLFNDQYIVQPKFDRRTKIGKDEYLEFCNKHGEKDFLTIEEMDGIEIIENNILSCKLVKNLLISSQKEMTFFWKDDDELFKCRPDAYIVEDRIVIDIKTTQDASFNSFRKSIVKYSYDVQAAFYLDGISACSLEADTFIFIAIENQPPYDFAIYKLLDPDVEAGRIIYKNMIKKYKESQHKWYPKHIQPMSMSAYGFDTDSRS